MVSVKKISTNLVKKLDLEQVVLKLTISIPKSRQHLPDVRVFAAGSRGLRRVGAENETKPPPKARSNLKTSSAVSVPVTKQQKNEKTINDTTLEEIVNLDESMSTSLEEAIYYKPRSKARKSEEKVSTSEDVAAVEEEEEKVEEVPVVRGISLKDFQSHQKLMEEQNKQKKDLLYKAIEQQ